MDNPKTLLTYHDLTVEVEYAPGQELKDHLAGTTLGTPGGFRYRHEGLDERLESAEEQYFLYLRKSGNMMGSVGFVWRNLTSAGLTHDSWLIRYFSIKAPMRSAPVRDAKKSAPKEQGKSDSVLGRFMKPVMDEPSRLRQQPQEQEAAIIYALIESKNLRSLNFSRQMGLEPVADIANFTFSRIQPRPSARVGRIAPEEIPEMQSRLREFYADYALYFPDPLFKDQDYYVIRDDRGIVAGAQIYRVTWKIVDFGSQLANRGLRLVARLGFVRKRFDPDALRLLVFDGLYLAEGRENELYELLEGILAAEKSHVGMLNMDRKSDLFALFHSGKKLGLLHRFFGVFSSHLMVRFVRMPREAEQWIREKPVYIPGYDNS